MSGNVEATRLDLKRDFKSFYTAPIQQVVSVELPSLPLLMLNGKGDPNTAQAYKDAVEALYTLTYTTKFLLKKEAGIDYSIMPLEGLWWADGGREAPRAQWQWTMMIMQPECVTNEWLARARSKAQQKKQLQALEQVRLEHFHEGKAAQIMHIGPYADEGPTIEKLHHFLQDNGYTFHGKHHEIYLNDPRRVAPDKMRTLLRQPFR